MTAQESPSPTAVVIDGYSAGNYYPAAFRAAGVRVLHLQSTPELIPTMAPPDLTAYAENIVATDEDEIVRRLRAYAPIAVVAGQESSVRLADRVSETLGVSSNGAAASSARRDKYEMTETLRRRGVRCVDQFKTDDVAAAVKWAEGRGGWPVVVKPISSAASDGVVVCAGPEEVRAAAEYVLSSRDIFGFANTEVLVQAYLKGQEYVVDTVSSDGNRYVCGVWRYDKRLLPSGRNIYNRDILVPSDEDPVPALAAYTKQVLDALDVRWGPSHAEIIVTEAGPVLVEIATRFNGQLNPGYQRVCVGRDQAELSVLAYTDPAAFARDLGGGAYRMLQPAYTYNPPTALDGVVGEVDQDVMARIAALPSTFASSAKYRPGDRIRPTVDLLTTGVRIYLTHPDPGQLAADYERAQALKDEVYRLR